MDFQSLVERKLEPTGWSNQDTIYRCPRCEGTEGSGHLYINYEKEKFHCFKCGYKGRRLEALLKDLHIDVDLDYQKFYNEQNSALDEIITPPKKLSNKVINYSTNLEYLEAYYNLHTKPISDEAYQYLLRRGLTLDMIYRLGIREGVNHYGERFKIGDNFYDGRDYSGRIMVPSLRRDGGISFYLGRDYIGDKPAKYMNPPKELAAASEDVWNLDIVNSDSVIICEGVFTAIAASPYKMNAVATYGKSIAQKSSNDSGILVTSQGEKLLSKGFKNYYVAYDADAYEESVKSCSYLYDRGANVYMVRIDPKRYGAHADVADIGYDEFMNLLREAIRYDGGLSSLTFDS